MKNPIRQVIDNHKVQQEYIREKILAAVKQAFPIVSKKFTIRASNFNVKPKNYSFAEEKSKILSLGSTTEPLTADLQLIENKSGSTLSMEPNFRIISIPVMTGMHTFIKDGNNYAVANVVTLKPGIYPRKSESGRIEAHFNLAGRNFRMYFDGAKQNFILEFGGRSTSLYSVLKAIGADEGLMIRHWGNEILNNIKAKTMSTVLPDAYKFLTFVNPRTSLGRTSNLNEIGGEIKNYFTSYTDMDSSVNERTIGKGFNQLNAEAFIISAGKLLRLFRGDPGEKIEPRDNPVFKRLHTVDDQFYWDITNSIPEIKQKIIHRLDYISDVPQKGIRGILPINFLSKPLDVLLTQSQRKNMPTQVNPLEIMDTMTKVTPLGEMGIKDLDQVPEESRYLQNGHLGIIDPLRTPESKSTGVDLRLSTSSGKDARGDMHAYVKNMKTGQEEYVNIANLTKKVIAFPQQNKKLQGGKVEAMKDGEVQLVDPKEVDYALTTTHHMLSPTSTLVPLIEGMQGNRVVMASKMMTQAVSLKDREEPLVQTLTNRTTDKNETSEEVFGKNHCVWSDITGTVEEISPTKIVIRGSAGKSVKDLMDHYPLNQKAYLHHTPLVKVGDKVKKGQLLAKSNFANDKGNLALGTSLRTAYMPYYGYNTNDALVISEKAAKKLTSTHLTKKTYHKINNAIIDKQKYVQVFPNKFSILDLNHLDDSGVVKPGSVIDGEAPLVLAMVPNETSYENKILGNISRSLVKPYRDDALIWDSDKKATVKDVVKVGSNIVVTLFTEEPMVEGDKLTGRFGNKGVVSKIIPTDQMPHTEDGEPLDVLIGSTSVVSRVNPNQIVETALGKVAKKIGKRIAIPHFNQEDNVEMAKNLLKKYNLKDKETVIDPISGRKIPNVMVGDQYALKLYKQTHTNFNAHGLGAYDINEQPAKPGGDDSAIALGGMEVNALIASNARNFLKDSSTIKSQRNDDYWNAVRLGLPTPKPVENFAYGKFITSLKGSGIKVNQKQSTISLAPLTNRDIKEMSSGEIKNPLTLRGKDYRPEKGGLFDLGITGGITGKRWGHIRLAEDMVNPVFESNVRVLLNLTPIEFDKKMAQEGGAWFKKALSDLNIKKEIARAEKDIRTEKGSSLDKAIKRYNILNGLKEKGITKIDDAYVLSMLPVTPPVTRPVVPLRDGKNVVVSDINHYYSDIILRNEKFKELKKEFSGSLLEPRRVDLYKNVKALIGLGPSTSKELKNKKVKGFLANLAGDSPKYGYIQSKLVSRKQDLTGRGTAIPDLNLDMDEVGLPEKMCWRMFEPYIMRELTSRGYPAKEASKMIEDETPVARIAMESVVNKYPVLMNRAPTLWRHNIVGAYAKPISGKTIRVNPFIEDGMNLDYDGDSCISLILLKKNSEKSEYGNCLNLDKNLDTSCEGRYLTQGDNMHAKKTKCISGYEVLHISEFPHLKETLETFSNGNEKYQVPAGTRVLAYNTKNKCIEEGEVSHFSIHKNLEAFKVTTNRGRSAIFSRNKSIFAVNLYTLVPEETPTLQSKNLLVPRLFDDFKEKIDTIKLSKYYTYKCKDILIDDLYLSKDIGWFMGLTIGEGWGTLSSNSNLACIAIEKDSIAEYYKSIVAKITNKEAKRYEQRNKDFHAGKYVSVKYTYCYTDLAEIICNLFGHGASNKHLPHFFLQTPVEFRYGLLSGLIDGDGSFSCVHAKGKKPQYMCIYHSSSERLAEEITLLAATLGIESSITPYLSSTTGTQMYEVYLSAYNIYQKKCLKLQHPEKRSPYKEMLQKPFDLASASSYMDIIPINPQFLKILKKKLNDKNSSSEQYLIRRRLMGGLIKDKEHLAKVRRKLIKRLIDLKSEDWLKNNSLAIYEAYIDQPKTKGWDDLLLESKDVSALVDLLKEGFKDEKIKKVESLYQIIIKKEKMKENFVTRNFISQLFEFIPIEEFKELPYGNIVYAYYENKKVRWDVIEKIEELPERMTMYDLTVPGYDTFTLANQLVAYDTLQIHVPATDKGIEDVKRMTLSQVLFHDKTKNKSLLVYPKHETIVGIAKSLKSPITGKVYKFNNEQEAISAYNAGKIKLNDIVEIKK